MTKYTTLFNTHVTDIDCIVCDVVVLMNQVVNLSSLLLCFIACLGCYRCFRRTRLGWARRSFGCQRCLRRLLPRRATLAIAVPRLLLVSFVVLAVIGALAERG